MADLSEYRIFEGVEFRDEVKTLMQIFADSWDECREEDCSRCKYRHGKEQYTLMACLSERYAEKLIAADVAPVRHGRWIKRGYACGDNEYECSVCHETEWRTSAIRLKYCPYCGADMRGGGEDG